MDLWCKLWATPSADIVLSLGHISRRTSPGGVTMVETIVVNLRYCYCCHLIDWQQAGAHEKGWNWFGASLLSFLAVFIGNIQKYSKISLIYKPHLRNPVYAPVADGNLLLRTSSKADILNSPKLALKDSPTGGATPLHSTPPFRFLYETSAGVITWRQHLFASSAATAPPATLWQIWQCCKAKQKHAGSAKSKSNKQANADAAATPL